MRENTERIEQYLSSIKVPQCQCGEHRYGLRRRILEGLGERLIPSPGGRAWKCAALIGLICAGLVVAVVVVVSIKDHKHPSSDKHPTIGSIANRQDNQSVASIAESNQPDPDQTAILMEDLPLLKQQSSGQLVAVGEIRVNGRLDSRTLTYEYRLPDNRTIYMTQPDPNTGNPQEPIDPWLNTGQRLVHTTGTNEGAVTIGTTQGREVPHAVTTANADIVATYDKIVQGRAFRFESRRFIFSDGTEITYSTGKPQDSR